HRQMCRSAADAHPRGDCTRHPVRKTPLHVPDMGAHIRQGLSHMFYVPPPPEGVTCSPLSGTTWLPSGLPRLSIKEQQRARRLTHYARAGDRTIQAVDKHDQGSLV